MKRTDDESWAFGDGRISRWITDAVVAHDGLLAAMDPRECTGVRGCPAIPAGVDFRDDSNVGYGAPPVSTVNHQVAPSPSEWWRRLVLAILLLGTVGTAVELLLLGHYEDRWQLAPLVLAATVLLTLTWYRVSSSHRPVLLLRWLSIITAASAAVGIYFHYMANVEWELETTPDLHGFALFREVITGALPLLAPGTMLQLGLLGLVWAYRHPRLIDPTHAAAPTTEN